MADTKATTLEEGSRHLDGGKCEPGVPAASVPTNPVPPRCKLCAAPFAGIGSFVLSPPGSRAPLAIQP